MSGDKGTFNSQLHQILVNRFDIAELRLLCFYIEVKYEDLGGAGKKDKARELIEHLERRSKISQLVETGKQLRPDIPWNDLPKPTDKTPPAIQEQGPRIVRQEVAKRTAGKIEVDPDLVREDYARQPFEPEMVLIHSGKFFMGSDPIRDKAAYPNELPQHKLYLPDYYIAKTPVTNKQYNLFVQATGYVRRHYFNTIVKAIYNDAKRTALPPDRIPFDNCPIVNVTWYDAVAYCHWLSMLTGKPYRLPSEAEWEKGARDVYRHIYPWGNQWDAGKCNAQVKVKKGSLRSAMDRVSDRFKSPISTPVGDYPQGASPYGLLDMAGNVWEWTLSLGDKGSTVPRFKYPYDSTDGRENPGASYQVCRILRGGSFLSTDKNLVRCAFRGSWWPPYYREDVGFRVVIAQYNFSR